MENKYNEKYPITIVINNYFKHYNNLLISISENIICLFFLDLYTHK